MGDICAPKGEGDGDGTNKERSPGLTGSATPFQTSQFPLLNDRRTLPPSVGDESIFTAFTTPDVEAYEKAVPQYFPPAEVS